MNNVRKAGGWICFYPNIRLDLWHSTSQLHECLHHALMLADVVKVSEEELLVISGEKDIRKGMDVLVARHSLAILLVTQGKEGVTAYWKTDFITFLARVWKAWIPRGRGTPSCRGCWQHWHPGGCQR